MTGKYLFWTQRKTKQHTLSQDALKNTNTKIGIWPQCGSDVKDSRIWERLIGWRLEHTHLELQCIERLTAALSTCWGKCVFKDYLMPSIPPSLPMLNYSKAPLIALIINISAAVTREHSCCATIGRCVQREKRCTNFLFVSLCVYMLLHPFGTSIIRFAVYLLVSTIYPVGSEGHFALPLFSHQPAACRMTAPES